MSTIEAFRSFEEALDYVRALAVAPVSLPIANDATFGDEPDTMGAGIAMIVDTFLSKGYEPDGFEQVPGLRIYRFKPFG